jgi:predicted RNA-binding Zn-ribbon protein involved in translation (DUF1610 family)
MKFATPGNRNRHQQEHFVSFNCKSCSKAYTRKDALDEHVKNIHGQPEKYRCPWCRKHLIGRNQKNYHMKKQCKKKPDDKKTG